MDNDWKNTKKRDTLRGRQTPENQSRRRSPYGLDSDEEYRDGRERKPNDRERDYRGRKTPDFQKRKSPIDGIGKDRGFYVKFTKFNWLITKIFILQKDEKRRSITPSKSEKSKYGRRTPKYDDEEERQVPGIKILLKGHITDLLYLNI